MYTFGGDFMLSVLDVAKYILEHVGEITAMKLQKLVYYSQAWSLVWDEAPLFEESIEAWANGPVVRRLYDMHKGNFKVSAFDIPGDSSKLSSGQQETINGVLDFYGKKTAQWLSDLTHMESPWIDARAEAGLIDGERGFDVIISTASIHEYYSSL